MSPNMNIETSVQVKSGRYVDLLQPDFSCVDIEDIAHGLAHECRFNGSCEKFYSVAEHSVRASFLLNDPALQFQALMHDAAEVLTGDMITPFKKLFPEIKAIEDNIMRALGRRFSFPWPLAPEVKEVDLIMLATERRDLMPADGARWTVLDGVTPDNNTIYPWSPKYAKCKFLERFDQLVVRQIHNRRQPS